MQSAALQECVRAPALPVCTPVTLTHVVTVATGVRSAVQNLDNVVRDGLSHLPPPPSLSTTIPCLNTPPVLPENDINKTDSSINPITRHKPVTLIIATMVISQIPIKTCGITAICR